MSQPFKDAFVVRKIDDTWYLRRVTVDTGGEYDRNGYQQVYTFTSKEDALQAAHTLDKETPTVLGVVELRETPSRELVLN